MIRSPGLPPPSTKPALGIHPCRWPGCPHYVPQRMWGCRFHWFLLPKVLRARIWAAYRPGQEIDGKSSAAYLAATLAAQRWIVRHLKKGGE